MNPYFLNVSPRIDDRHLRLNQNDNPAPPTLPIEEETILRDPPSMASVDWRLADAQRGVLAAEALVGLAGSTPAGVSLSPEITGDMILDDRNEIGQVRVLPSGGTVALRDPRSVEHLLEPPRQTGVMSPDGFYGTPEAIDAARRAHQADMLARNAGLISELRSVGQEQIQRMTEPSAKQVETLARWRQNGRTAALNRTDNGRRLLEAERAERENDANRETGIRAEELRAVGARAAASAESQIKLAVAQLNADAQVESARIKAQGDRDIAQQKSGKDRYMAVGANIYDMQTGAWVDQNGKQTETMADMGIKELNGAYNEALKRFDVNPQRYDQYANEMRQAGNDKNLATKIKQKWSAEIPRQVLDYLDLLKGEFTSREELQKKREKQQIQKKAMSPDSQNSTFLPPRETSPY